VVRTEDGQTRRRLAAKELSAPVRASARTRAAPPRPATTAVLAATTTTYDADLVDVLADERIAL
jgi:hypothetical protein